MPEKVCTRSAGEWGFSLGKQVKKTRSGSYSASRSSAAQKEEGHVVTARLPLSASPIIPRHSFQRLVLAGQSVGSNQLAKLLKACSGFKMLKSSPHSDAMHASPMSIPNQYLDSSTMRKRKSKLKTTILRNDFNATEHMQDPQADSSFSWDLCTAASASNQDGYFYRPQRRRVPHTSRPAPRAILAPRLLIDPRVVPAVSWRHSGVRTVVVYATTAYRVVGSVYERPRMRPDRRSPTGTGAATNLFHPLVASRIPPEVPARRTGQTLPRSPRREGSRTSSFDPTQPIIVPAGRKPPRPRTHRAEDGPTEMRVMQCGGRTGRAGYSTKKWNFLVQCWEWFWPLAMRLTPWPTTRYDDDGHARTHVPDVCAPQHQMKRMQTRDKKADAEVAEDAAPMVAAAARRARKSVNRNRVDIETSNNTHVREKPMGFDGDAARAGADTPSGVLERAQQPTELRGIRNGRAYRTNHEELRVNFLLKSVCQAQSKTYVPFPHAGFPVKSQRNIGS
ncbi:hypothetical protein B0H13DRAFT_1852237 [Mycena leptocephala]|nr:hypothetical protein B0H13DRAFT_1852237 [Mycena leptocephala]